MKVKLPRVYTGAEIVRIFKSAVFQKSPDEKLSSRRNQ